MAKKKAKTGGGGGAGKNKNLTIELPASGGAEPRNPILASAGKNKVRFSNLAKRGLTVAFEYWPFVEAPIPIVMEAGKKSPWFDVVANVPKGPYSYSVTPDLSIGEAPPDPPGVSFNG